MQDENHLVELYQELTGATEAQARNVFMFVCRESCPTHNGSLEQSPPATNTTDRPRA